MKKKQKKKIKNFIELLTKALIAIASVITAIAQLIEVLKWQEGERNLPDS